MIKFYSSALVMETLEKYHKEISCLNLQLKLLSIRNKIKSKLEKFLKSIKYYQTILLCSQQLNRIIKTLDK